MLFRISITTLASAALLHAGPYSAGMDDPANTRDAPVPGFTGPHGSGMARLETGEFDENYDPIFSNPDNYVNPLFFGWAGDVVDYSPSTFAINADQSDPFWTLGPVSGDHFWGIVSLGDQDIPDIGTTPAGTITLELDRPVKNLSGADFVVFENAYIAQSDYGGAGIGGVFAELGFVEVSSDGIDFVRFPATSLTEASPGRYGSLDPTKIHNLAGKHVNAYGDCWGTPFDLDDVDLAEITHVRIVDIPGTGAVTDSLGSPIFDPWFTTGTGGFDLDAIGAIAAPISFYDWPQLEPVDFSDQLPDADPDSDGLTNLLEYAFARLPWKADTGNTPACSLSGTDAVFTFIRDERLSDLTYDVQVSETLTGPWSTIATSAGGGPVTPAAGHSPVVSEAPASGITGIGVIREVSVREPVSPSARKFYRVLVSQSEP